MLATVVLHRRSQGVRSEPQLAVALPKFCSTASERACDTRSAASAASSLPDCSLQLVARSADRLLRPVALQLDAPLHFGLGLARDECLRRDVGERGSERRDGLCTGGLDLVTACSSSARSSMRVSAVSQNFSISAGVTLARTAACRPRLVPPPRGPRSTAVDWRSSALAARAERGSRERHGPSMPRRWRMSAIAMGSGSLSAGASSRAKLLAHRARTALGPSRSCRSADGVPRRHRARQRAHRCRPPAPWPATASRLRGAPTRL